MNDLAQKILHYLETDPMGWSFNELTAQYGDLEIWTANSPYADLYIYLPFRLNSGPRIGNWWTRHKIRKAMTRAIELQGLKHINKNKLEDE